MLLRLLIFCSLLGAALAQDPRGRSESNLGQIVVYGSEARVRTEVIQGAEALIRDLESLVGSPEGQASPIVIELYPPVTGKPGAVRRELLTLPEQKDRFRFQINVRLSAPEVYPRDDLQRTLLEVFLIERGIREVSPDDLPEHLNLFPWLIDGIAEAIAWKAKKGERAVYAALRDNGGWMSIDKLIDVEKTGSFDVLSRELFRASSGALTMALLAQPEGKKSMNAYLAEASGFEGEPIELLRKNFPDVNLGREGLEKWWLTQVAALAAPALTQTMTIELTEKELAASLKLYLPDENGRLVVRELDAWPEVMAMEKNEDRLSAIRQASDMLVGLSYRSFPTYRPVIAGYLKILSDLTGEKSDHIVGALDNLKMFREAERRRYERLVDLLDWYHLSTVQEESGEFDDYLLIKKELEKAEVPADDPLIKYVDEAQQLFDRRKNSAR